jgi:trehalose 6-phosphate synthase/phosphatase
MVMIVVPSREQVKKYGELKEEIDTLVGMINSNYATFNWVPVHYFYRSFPFPELSAFYSLADVALVTPLRDGMNLVCKEFVASKTDQKGVLILSEMAGASKELYDALLVNPNNILEVSQAINDALSMEEEKQIKNITSMQHILKCYDIFQWVNVFMERLDHVKRKQEELKSRKIDEKRVNLIQADFRHSNKPIVFLDYDGTLVSYKTKPEKAFPDDELKSVIYRLAKKALVVIISGRDRKTLGHWFKDQPVNLMAEHGLWILRKDRGEDWVPLMQIDNSWKPDIRVVMDYYILRTPGTFVEEKSNSLVWHYRLAENGLGELRMREMICHVKYVAHGNNLQVMEGNKFLEIKKPDINKSKAAMDFITHEGFDFILAIGDHWSDEDTFKALPKWAYSIRVGYNYTHAKFNVHSYKEVEYLLKRLIKTEALGLVTA